MNTDKAKKIRVLHCPTDCGAFGPVMARCEREQGFDSWSLAFAQSYLGYECDEVLGGRALSKLLDLEIARWKILWRAIRHYDVIFYNYGTTIMPTPVFIGFGEHYRFLRVFYSVYALFFDMLDVRILKLLGKKIFVVFQGGDGRRKEILEKHYAWSDADEEPEGYYYRLAETLKRHRAKVWDKLADEIYYINPDLGHGLPKRAKFMPYACPQMDVINQSAKSARK